MPQTETPLRSLLMHVVITMSGVPPSSKIRKVDKENRKFKEEWSEKYFFSAQDKGALCLICDTRISVVKEFNIKRHFETHHEKAFAAFSSDQRLRKLNILRNDHAER